jgi:hypothetical protein
MTIQEQSAKRFDRAPVAEGIAGQYAKSLLEAGAQILLPERVPPQFAERALAG